MFNQNLVHIMKSIEVFYQNRGIDLKNMKHPISKMIYETPLKTKAEQESSKFFLKKLGNALVDIKSFNKSIYRKYISRIVTCLDNDSIYGHIFEIMQCAHFIRVAKDKNFTFKFGDANKFEPDFFFNNFGFEITSCRFTDKSENFEPAEKLLNTFKKKNKKKYISNKTGLLIDITNISEKAYEKPVSMSLEQVCEIIKKESQFGMVLCFTEWIDKLTLNSTLICSADIFSDNCDPELKNMIETYFFKKNNIIGGTNFLSKNK